eukprot:TRINITY_DN4023_c0_g1_i1.p1 TRINITY_DN4023_c0_g1~~TRINITY_DN4023_c0_g1_i1.p1  ORF type:complete len:276 (+),score=55.78 TRINITY_DN4023_c0_g1_i1:54-881(+)
MLLQVHRAIRRGGIRGIIQRSRCKASTVNQRRWNFGGERDPERTPSNPMEFVNEFKKDIQMFPEYFNPVTYTVFFLIMLYLLFVTSNGRGRKWFYKHFTLSQENINDGRFYTILTHPILETSIVSLAINLMIVRWGGNMVLNLGGGEAGFIRSLAVLTVVPGILYTAVTSGGSTLKTHEQYINIGGAVVPTTHFSTAESVSGFHAISAGLLANGVLEVGKRFPHSTFFGVRAPSALPLLTATYIILATSGSSDSWLSLCGVATAVSYRFFMNTGF